MPDISTIEMHTGGEPVRIIVDGFPDVVGDTLLDKRRYAAEQLDELRRLVMLEPRGHYDMYGVLPVAPDDPDADMAVLFMHNDGWSTMCGHATLALGRYIVDRGIVAATEPTTTVRLQVPSGLVTVTVDVANGLTGASRYVSMPSFVSVSGLAIAPEKLGPLTVDIAYGGAFYALADANDLGWDLAAQPVAAIRSAGSAITAAVNAATEIRHPDSPDLGFLYGTILSDGPRGALNVCVFADAQIDRSPTGSGVQARLARDFAGGALGLGEVRRFRSIVGSEFTGQVLSTARVGKLDAVVVEVGGTSFYTGESTFRTEAEDGLQSFVVS